MKRLPAFAVLWALSAPLAFADGMAFVKMPNRVEWSFLGENAQSALIHFYKGREALVISVAPEKSISRAAAVWFFPVPARPEDVTIDILSGDAHFEGNDILSDFRSGLRSAADAAAAYSLAPVSLFVSPLMVSRGPSRQRHWLALGDDGRPSEIADVEVHAQVSRFGLTTQLVTARTSGALVEHLAAKGMILPVESAAFLDWYIGRDYSFVVSFKAPEDPPGAGETGIPANDPTPGFFPVDLLKKGANPSGRRPTIGHGRVGPDGRYTVVEEPMTDAEYAAWVEQFKATADSPRPSVRPEPGAIEFSTGLSALVSFPADRIFFPMRPTAIYGQRRVPVDLLISGFVKPRLAGRLREGASISFLKGTLGFSEPKSAFLLGRPDEEAWEFTRIRLDAPADAFREDLWISPAEPVQLKLIRFLSATGWLWIAVLYAGFSALASLAAGTVVFKKDRPSARRLAAHGLWNCLTLMAFVIATAAIMKAKRLPESLEAEIRKTGLNVMVWNGEKIYFGLLFYLIFMILIAATAGGLTFILLGPYS
jgi:hypothetical protein